MDSLNTIDCVGSERYQITQKAETFGPHEYKIYDLKYQKQASFYDLAVFDIGQAAEDVGELRK